MTDKSGSKSKRDDVSDEVLQSIDIDDVKCGDVCKVLPGCGIPTDGVITTGSSFVDEAMITGAAVDIINFSIFRDLNLKLLL